MFSNYLSSIEGVGIYPIISLLVFLIFFIVLLIWMWKADKLYLKKMGEMPLDLEESTNKNFLGENNED